MRNVPKNTGGNLPLYGIVFFKIGLQISFESLEKGSLLGQLLSIECQTAPKFLKNGNYLVP